MYRACYNMTRMLHKESQGESRVRENRTHGLVDEVKRDANKRRAFTLIELLVVIAIISLLVSILLPSLNKAKDLARSAVCMTNQKALFMAACYYVEDNNEEIFPVQVNSSIESANRWRQWPWKLAAGGYAEYDNDAVRLTSEMFYCPSWSPESSKELIDEYPDPSSNTWVCIYGMREWIQPGAPVNLLGFESYKEFTRIENPAEFFLFGDSYLTTTGMQIYAIGRQANAQRKRIHLRHSDRANLGYADGHVAPADEDYVLSVGDDQWDYTYGTFLPWPE